MVYEYAALKSAMYIDWNQEMILCFVEIARVYKDKGG